MRYATETFIEEEFLLHEPCWASQKLAHANQNDDIIFKKRLDWTELEGEIGLHRH